MSKHDLHFGDMEEARTFCLENYCYQLCLGNKLCNPELTKKREMLWTCLEIRTNLCPHYENKLIRGLGSGDLICSNPTGQSRCLLKQCRELPNIVWDAQTPEGLGRTEVFRETLRALEAKFPEPEEDTPFRAVPDDLPADVRARQFKDD